MAVAIMVSTFGTINALILTGARAYYAMAQQRLFFRFGGQLNRPEFLNPPCGSRDVGHPSSAATHL